jgi:hypothetical protein
MVPCRTALPFTVFAVPLVATTRPSVSGGGGGRLAMWISPRAAGWPPSQCCSKVASKVCTYPAGPKTELATVNEPVRVLQPRPLPNRLRPGPVPLNGNRVAPV